MNCPWEEVGFGIRRGLNQAVKRSDVRTVPGNPGPNGQINGRSPFFFLARRGGKDHNVKFNQIKILPKKNNIRVSNIKKISKLNSVTP